MRIKTKRILAAISSLAWTTVTGAALCYLLWQNGQAHDRIRALEAETWALEIHKADAHNLHAWQDNELEDRLWRIEEQLARAAFRLETTEARLAATDSTVAANHLTPADWEQIVREAAHETDKRLMRRIKDGHW